MHYFSYTNSNEEDMKEQFRSKATESVKTELVVEAITKAEGITVSEEEFEAELAKMSEAFNQRAEVLKKSLESRGELDFIKNGLAYQKTVTFLIDQNA